MNSAKDNILNLLYKSNRPVLFLGNGARNSNWETLKNILGIPVFLTWKSMDFLDENDPLFCGRPGMISTRGANINLQNCDLLLCIGTRLDCLTVAYNYRNFAYNAQKIVVDIDRAELNKLPQNWIKVNQDAKKFIDDLIDNLNCSQFREQLFSNWSSRARQTYLKYRDCSKTEHTDKVDTYKFIGVLSDRLDKNDVIISGSSGVNIEIFYQTFKVKKGQRIIGLPGFGAMGTGLPLAIGVARAIQVAQMDNKDSAMIKRVVLLDGDGSFQVNIQELETVRRLELPLKIFIFSNGGYGSIYNMQKKRFGRFVGCDKKSGLTLPYLDCIAQVWGGHSNRVSSWCIWKDSQIEEYLESILADEQVLCEIVVPIDQKVEPIVNSTLREDGSYQIDSMENMYPYLPKEELIKEMIIPIMERCPNFMGASIPLKKLKGE